MEVQAFFSKECALNAIISFPELFFAFPNKGYLYPPALS
jgi:hypothetical protein